MKTNFLCGPSVALISIGCLGANLGACSSTSCADTDSCGAYQPPDVCDGGAECADGAVDTAETGVVPRADAGVDANRDIAVDGAGAVVDAQDVPDAGDATGPVNHMGRPARSHLHPDRRFPAEGEGKGRGKSNPVVASARVNGAVDRFEAPRAA